MTRPPACRGRDESTDRSARAMRDELAGRCIRLRPLAEADMARRSEWTADDELVRMMGADPEEEPFVSREEECRRNVEWLHERRRAGDALYAIEVCGRYIGDIDIFFPNEANAELTVFIGDRTEWGKGYGTESVRLVLDELVRGGVISTVQVDVAKRNERAPAFWTKLGFSHYATDETGATWLRWSKPSVLGTGEQR